MKIKHQFEFVINGKLHPEHTLIPYPWEKSVVGNAISFPDNGCMRLATVTEVHARFSDDRKTVLMRIVADVNC